MSPDLALWHKCEVILPRLTIDGGLTLTGQVWRREHPDPRWWRRWEYKQSAETNEEFNDRAV